MIDHEATPRTGRACQGTTMHLMLSRRCAATALLIALAAGQGCHTYRPATHATLHPAPRLRLDSREGLLVRARLADGSVAPTGCTARRVTATLRQIAGDTLMLDEVSIQRRGPDGAACAPPATAAVVVTAHADLQLFVVEPSARRTFLAGSVAGMAVWAYFFWRVWLCAICGDT